MLSALIAGITVSGAAFLLQDERRREALRQAANNALRYIRVWVTPISQRFAEERRRREIEQCLPEFLRLSASCIRASLTVRQAVHECAAMLTGPLGEELRQADRELKSGISLESALENMAARVKISELDMAVTLLLAGSAYGGDIAGAMASLTAIVRKRLAGRREKSVLTAQARYSSLILAALPVAFMVFFPGSSGKGLLGVLSQPLGWVVIVCGLALNGGGFVLMRRLANPGRL